MSCDDLYNCDYRKFIQDSVRDALKCVDSQGLLLYSSDEDIYIVYEIENGGDPSKYIKPSIVCKKEKITPSPMFSLTTEMYQQDRIIQKSGVAYLSKLIASDNDSENYTREQLEGASYFLIGDSIYDLVEGSLTRESNGVFWKMEIKRRQVGDRLKK